MKTKNLFFLLFMLVSPIFCVGQYKITVSDISNLERKIFDDENQTSISVSALNKGFELRISKTNFSKATGQNKDTKAWEEQVLGAKRDDDNYIIYEKIVISSSPNDTKEIQLTLLDGSIKTLKLQVSEDVPINSSTCTPLNLPDECPIERNYDNKFRENVKFYDKRTVVYIYDFNYAKDSDKDFNSRNFYKITKAKRSDKRGQDFIIDVKVKAKKKELNKAKREFKKDPSDQNKGDLIKKSTELDALEKTEAGDGLKIEVVNFEKEKLRSGKNVKFKIYHINRFVYDVSIADTVILFGSDPNALLSRFFLGDSTLLGSLMGAFSDKTIAQSTIPGLGDLSEDIKCFVEKYNWLQNKALKVYDPCYSFPCCYSIEYTELANDLSAIRTDAVKIQQHIDDKKKTVAENKKKIDDCDKTKADLESVKKGIDAFLKNTSSKEPEKEDELKALRKKETDLNAKLCKEADYLSYKKQKEDTEKELLNLAAVNTLLTNLPSDQELKRLIVFLKNMVETNSYYTSDYISLNGNMLDLTISIASKDSVTKYFPIPEYKPIPRPIQIPIIWKPFVSFSSGSFIALGTNVQNKTYAWQETVGNNNTATDSNFTLVESGYTLPPMGFCALGNLEWRASRSFGIGGSFGVGLTIENSPRLAYMAGASLFFGELHQFNTTFGFVGMQVDRLTNNYQTVSDNQVIYTSQPDIQYYKEFKVGAFVSLTYTPFQVHKTKTVKP